MNHLIDQYLLYRIRTKRDAEAYGRLYDRYVPSIYRFVFLKLPSKEMAEDVSSETFLRCWQYLQQDRRITHIRALLYQIARNLVADYYRRNRPEESLDAVVTFSASGASSDSKAELSDRNRGSAVIEARAELALVIERISRLKEDYQDVLQLRLIDGLSFGDISAITEKSAGHVRVIYHRAMKALEQLEKRPNT